MAASSTVAAVFAVLAAVTAPLALVVIHGDGSSAPSLAEHELVASRTAAGSANAVSVFGVEAACDTAEDQALGRTFSRAQEHRGPYGRRPVISSLRTRVIRSDQSEDALTAWPIATCEVSAHVTWRCGAPD